MKVIKWYEWYLNIARPFLDMFLSNDESMSLSIIILPNAVSVTRVRIRLNLELTLSRIFLTFYSIVPLNDFIPFSSRATFYFASGQIYQVFTATFALLEHCILIRYLRISYIFQKPLCELVTCTGVTLTKTIKRWYPDRRFCIQYWLIRELYDIAHLDFLVETIWLPYHLSKTDM